MGGWSQIFVRWNIDFGGAERKGVIANFYKGMEPEGIIHYAIAGTDKFLRRVNELYDIVNIFDDETYETFAWLFGNEKLFDSNGVSNHIYWAYEDYKDTKDSEKFNSLLLYLYNSYYGGCFIDISGTVDLTVKDGSNNHLIVKYGFETFDFLRILGKKPEDNKELYHPYSLVEYWDLCEERYEKSINKQKEQLANIQEEIRQIETGEKKEPDLKRMSYADLIECEKKYFEALEMEKSDHAYNLSWFESYNKWLEEDNIKALTTEELDEMFTTDYTEFLKDSLELMED